MGTVNKMPGQRKQVMTVWEIMSRLVRKGDPPDVWDEAQFILSIHPSPRSLCSTACIGSRDYLLVGGKDNYISTSTHLSQRIKVALDN